MAGERIRVVAVLEGRVVPAWIERVLLDVVSGESAELAGVLFTGSEGSSERRGGLLFRAYASLDRHRFALPNDPMTPVDVSSLLERGGLVASLPEAGPDVVLKLAVGPLSPDWLAAARLGVWSFDHIECASRGGVPFFWEAARNRPFTETCLRAHTADGSRVLARSWSATDTTSPVRNRHAALWKTSAFVARALRDALAAQDVAPEEVEPSAPAGPDRPPRPLELMRCVGSLGFRLVRGYLHRRTRDESWFIAMRRSEGSLVSGPMQGFEPIPMPGDRFHADPFLIPDGDHLWLFFEDGPRAGGKGVIRCSEVRPDGRLGESRVVLERDHHLSYPFVFRSGDAWFMLPETWEHRTLELWRAVEFPWRWELEKVLLADVAAVDPTLLEHAGQLWLFAAIGATADAAPDELFAFRADSIHGEWRPHPRNPIVSDARRARPAGPFFREAGQLHRPAQDCAEAYGSAIWIHRVDRLDEQAYRETPLRRVDGDWYPGLVATHTLSRAGGFDAIDGRVWMRPGTSPGPRRRRAGARRDRRPQNTE